MNDLSLLFNTSLKPSNRGCIAPGNIFGKIQIQFSPFKVPHQILVSSKAGEIFPGPKLARRDFERIIRAPVSSKHPSGPTYIKSSQVTANVTAIWRLTGSGAARRCRVQGAIRGAGTFENPPADSKREVRIGTVTDANVCAEAAARAREPCPCARAQTATNK